jgi:hypothetical protein
MEGRSGVALTQFSSSSSSRNEVVSAPAVAVNAFFAAAACAALTMYLAPCVVVGRSQLVGSWCLHATKEGPSCVGVTCVLDKVLLWGHYYRSWPASTPALWCGTLPVSLAGCMTHRMPSEGHRGGGHTCSDTVRLALYLWGWPRGQVCTWRGDRTDRLWPRRTASGHNTIMWGMIPHRAA